MVHTHKHSVDNLLTELLVNQPARAQPPLTTYWPRKLAYIYTIDINIHRIVNIHIYAAYTEVCSCVIRLVVVCLLYTYTCVLYARACVAPRSHDSAKVKAYTYILLYSTCGD